ncbi:smoothelin-like protein 1 isoform X2 [Bombina bombina]|nr:smoothelin-like protein 1 isoform X2 [Bombina bombina]
MDPPSPALYKTHSSPVSSPTRDTFHTPLGSPESGLTLGDPGIYHKQLRNDGGWHAPFGRAITRIHRASDSLGDMHIQLVALLSPGANTESPRILDSAMGWGARLGEVRSDLKAGLRELANLKAQYVAVSSGEVKKAATESSHGEENKRDSSSHNQVERERQEWQREREHLKTELQKRDDIIRVYSERVRELESRRPLEEETLKEFINQLEAEKEKYKETIKELQGEVKELGLLQADLRTAVSVAERFRAEAQEKLEAVEKENRKLKGSDQVDWRTSSTLNGNSQGYHSLPRGVILSSRRDNIVKSSSLMSVPPTQGFSQQPDVGSARRERRGSLETLLNEPKATENLTEDSGSFFRRYGGSKRGVFLRWAQDRTCGYKHVVITNFSTSWADGMALCALLHSYLPDSIPYAQLRPLEKRKNLQLAFQVAELAGIPQLLTPDHMLQTQGPDWQKVLLYVESIYQKFEA